MLDNLLEIDDQLLAIHNLHFLLCVLDLEAKFLALGFMVVYAFTFDLCCVLQDLF